MLWGSLGALVALIVLIAAVVAHSSGTKIEGSRIASVSRMDIAKSVVATGKVQPITKVEVKSKASGIVEKWYVDANARVHRGQVLAQLDRVEILAQVEAAHATLQAAEANVKTAEADIKQDEVAARAPDLPMYAATLRRNQEMKAAGIVSQQALDDADRDYLSNMNKQHTAIATVAVDRAKLLQAQAQVAESQASLKQLEEQLSYTTVVSPIDGVVLSRDVEVGDAVSSILVLGSTATLVFPRRYEPGVRRRQGGRSRYRECLHGPARPHPHRVLQESNLRRQGHAHRAVGSGERQCHDLRRPCLYRQSHR
jgi:HlyD family secretion protein